MPGRCREFDRAQESGLLDTSDLRDHLRRCESCAAAAKELQQLASALFDLRRRDAGAPAESTPLWLAVEARLARPTWLDRLPPTIANALRVAGAWTQPPVAAAWATGIAGACLGLWLGRAAVVVDTADPEAQAYEETSLIDGDQAGVATLFGASFTGQDDGGDSTQSQ